jgi:hypothetical protein
MGDVYPYILLATAYDSVRSSMKGEPLLNSSDNLTSSEKCLALIAARTS